MNLFHVDAFTNQIFKGNPAAVCFLEEWLAEDVLHSIAKENNLPVTAFLKEKNNGYEIRWITPEYELELCGHGSLAAAFVIFKYIKPGVSEIKFQSQKAGEITVYNKNNLIELNFPEKEIVPIAILEQIVSGLGKIPVAVYQHKSERILAVFENEEIIKNLLPDMHVLKSLEHRGIIVTAPSAQVDFVSRTFYPIKLIPEDAVTGASHCLLVPYWAKRLKKSELHAYQLSARGGELFCRYGDKRVLISGSACLYMQGEIVILSEGSCAN